LAQSGMASMGKPTLSKSMATLVATYAILSSGLVPTATHGQIRLRCVTQPDAGQAALLGRLGITLPKRMRLAEHELLASAATA